MKAAMLTAVQEERDGFRFLGGHPALDLADTLGARLAPDPIELLRSPQDLGRWLVAADLARTPPTTRRDDLANALKLRETIFDIAGGVAAGTGVSRPSRRVLNAIASAAAAAPQLGDKGGFELIGPADALLATLARDAIRLFGGESADRIRQCGSPTCTLYFVDMSPRGERRWCSMAGCGNRAKVAEFHRRRREGAESLQAKAKLGSEG